MLLIVGNIAPSIGGFKLHWFANGFTTLLVFISLFLLLDKWKFKAVFLGIFVLANIAFSVHTQIGELINTFSGPLIFVYFLIIIEKNLLITKGLKEVLYVFVVTSMLPITIGVFQFVGLLPFNIWAFDAVNITRSFGEPIQRVNGYLYHASELASLALFVFLILVIMTKRIYIAPLFVIFLLFQGVLLIKSAIGGFIIMTMYMFVSPIKFNWEVKNVAAIMGILGMILLYIVAGDQIMAVLYEKITPTRSQFFLPSDLLTGRGRIWSIYFYGILKYFSSWNYFFGGGFGSGKYMFDLILPSTKIAWVASFTPHPHNEFIHVFVNGGIALLSAYLYVFYWASKIIKKFNTTPYRIIPIAFIIFITAGMTVPISDRFAFWLSFSFLVIAFRLKSIATMAKRVNEKESDRVVL